MKTVHSIVNIDHLWYTKIVTDQYKVTISTTDTVEIRMKHID